MPHPTAAQLPSIQVPSAVHSRWEVSLLDTQLSLRCPPRTATGPEGGLGSVLGSVLGLATDFLYDLGLRFPSCTVGLVVLYIWKSS